MDGLIDIHRAGSFTLSEALDLVPIIYRFTDEARRKADKIVVEIETIKNLDPARAGELEYHARQVYEHWQDKVRKLGGIPNGVWVVDFDSGDGYYCWKFPEISIDHWHPYDQGFSARQPLPGRGSFAKVQTTS